MKVLLSELLWQARVHARLVTPPSPGFFRTFSSKMFWSTTRELHSL
jgi:hypothetical protein